LVGRKTCNLLVWEGNALSSETSRQVEDTCLFAGFAGCVYLTAADESCFGNKVSVFVKVVLLCSGIAYLRGRGRGREHLRPRCKAVVKLELLTHLLLLLLLVQGLCFSISFGVKRVSFCLKRRITTHLEVAKSFNFACRWGRGREPRASNPRPCNLCASCRITTAH
jgi:hypothetical protein